MARNHVHCALLSKKWGTLSPQRQWRPTTIPPTVVPLTPSNKSHQHAFYWIRNCVCQSQLQIYWSNGQTNRADYFSKHHLASHHQAIRSIYLYSPTNPTRNDFECLSDNDTATALANANCHANSLTNIFTAVAPQYELQKIDTPNPVLCNLLVSFLRT
jgi:hypothetical protein